ncbi:hypothetical protein OAL13_00135 [bacterium]|nr:hypothetical protein [bacterium]
MNLNNGQKLGAAALATGALAAVPALFSSPLLLAGALLSPAVAWKFYKGGALRRTLFTVATPLALATSFSIGTATNPEWNNPVNVAARAEQQAEREAERKEQQQAAEEAQREAEQTAEAPAPAPTQSTETQLNFTATTPMYAGTSDAYDDVTKGVGRYETNADRTIWYEEVSQGAYTGDRTYYACNADGSITRRYDAPRSNLVESTFTPEPGNSYSCTTTKDANGTPTQVKVFFTKKGSLTTTINFKPLANGAPTDVARATVDTSYRGPLFSYCKAQATARATTGRINWGFGGAGARASFWDGSQTVIMKGRSKNAFGTLMPFTIECQSTDSGMRVVQVSNR